MSRDAVGYVTANVGVNLDPSEDGVAYTYQNLGFFFASSHLGRVYGFSSLLRLAFVYAYQNVFALGGLWLLEDGSGSAWATEDGGRFQMELTTEET